MINGRKSGKSGNTGDVMTVTRIDRLARSTFDLFAIVKRIVDAGAQFRSMAEPWADTATSTGRLMIAVLGGLADVERDLIRTRTAEGRSRAKAATVRIELTSGRLKSIKGASSESGRAVSLDAPSRPVFQGPIKQGTFKTDVGASFLALDPFVTKDLLAFG